MASHSGSKAKEIFQGQVLLYKHMYAFIGSMCLKWCIDLGIPNIIHNHGQPITLHELALVLRVPPAKIGGVRSLMRCLSHDGFFEIVRIHDNQEEEEEEKEAYALTVASELLVKGTDHCLSPIAECALNQVLVDPFHHLKEWTHEEDLNLCELSLGSSFWDLVNKNPALMSSFNQSMASDSQMMRLALRDCDPVFEGLGTLVDVGGGTGTAAKIICDAFPELKCIVFDLPQVVDNLIGSNNLSYVSGDMFKSIPKADAVLLKWILHDWGDDDCIKILKNCKEAISTNHKRGKIIIIDIVINEKCDEHEVTQMKLQMDVVLTSCLNGKERSEEEWKKVLTGASFKDYKISPLTGFLSIIEVYA